MTHAPDVVVVGGGVIGCAVAYTLVAPGRSVLVVERGRVGGEASSAAAGVLSVASGTEEEGGRLAERQSSRARFPALVAALREETGIDVELVWCGVLELALSERDQRMQAERLGTRRAEGFRVEALDASAVRAAAPGVSPEVLGGLLFADDGRVGNVQLVQALAAAARRRGAEIREEVTVHAAERAGGRVARLRIGEAWVTPGIVVLAAGAWAGGIPGLGEGIAVEPVRGQMLALRADAPHVGPVLFHADGCLVPCGHEVLVGATVERAGFERVVTAAGLRALLAHVERIAPALLDAAVIRTWAGLRPHAPDGGPIVGRAADASNLIIACGHYRNGILLAPETAERVRALIEA